MNTYYSEMHRLHQTDGMTVNGCPFVTEELPERAEILLKTVKSIHKGEIFSPREHGLEPVLAVHDPDFVAFLQTIHPITGMEQPVFPGTFAPRSFRRKSTHPESLPGYYCFGTYSPILAGTWQAAYWSAQCAISAACDVIEHKTLAYALCRPPGHHAARDMYGGFCYLNNAAIAARYLQQNWTAAAGQPVKIAILDIDYHHGNGTQEIFYTDPSILFCSLHVDPDQDYPYFWGARDEKGDGVGWGFNHNWPLKKGTSDREYLENLITALRAIEEYSPACLVVSVGFDTGMDDPAGGFCLSPTGFYQIGSAINALDLPTLLVQEGGYKLDQLGDWSAAFLTAFSR